MKKIKFKYHPRLYQDEILTYGKDTCQCCGKEVSAYIKDSIYCRRKLSCVCLSCIHSGRAASKYNARFVQDAEPIFDLKKKDELFRRTPGYLSREGTYWLACCDDYCEYLGMVGVEEMEKLGIMEEVLQDYENRNGVYHVDIVKQYLSKDGNMSGYLFRCLHCGKYRIHVDSC